MYFGKAQVGPIHIVLFARTSTNATLIFQFISKAINSQHKSFVWKLNERTTAQAAFTGLGSLGTRPSESLVPRLGLGLHVTTLPLLIILLIAPHMGKWMHTYLSLMYHLHDQLYSNVPYPWVLNTVDKG